MSLTPRLVGLACLLAWPLSIVGAEGSSAVVGIGGKAPQPPNLPALIPPQPDLVAYAATHGLPLTGIDQTRRGAAGAPGDSVTALITLREEYGMINFMNLFVHQQVRTGRYAELYNKWVGEGEPANLTIPGVYR